jgi:hypothetical protein
MVVIIGGTSLQFHLANDIRTIMFSWLEWSDKPTSGEVREKMMKDECTFYSAE